MTVKRLRYIVLCVVLHCIDIKSMIFGSICSVVP